MFETCDEVRNKITCLLTGRFKTTCSERISNVIFSTGAGWYVVVDPTLGIGTAGARTGVDTLVPQTGSVRGAVRVDDTLRPAGNMGVSEVLWDTLTGGSISLFAAHSVGPTGRGVTGVDIFYFGRH